MERVEESQEIVGNEAHPVVPIMEGRHRTGPGTLHIRAPVVRVHESQTR
jgi:hypothetical protein